MSGVPRVSSGRWHTQALFWGVSRLESMGVSVISKLPLRTYNLLTFEEGVASAFVVKGDREGIRRESLTRAQ